MNCLAAWTNILCKHSGDTELGPLIYPLIQIICGTITLLPTARYYPLRFQCIDLLNRLSAAAGGVFVPTAPYLVEVRRRVNYTIPVLLQYVARRTCTLRNEQFHRFTLRSNTVSALSHLIFFQ